MMWNAPRPVTAKLEKGWLPDRFISLVDTEMRHGRKSASKKFDGFKVSTSMDQASELILDIEDMSAPLGRWPGPATCNERVEEHVGVTVERAMSMGRMAQARNRAACAERPTNRLTCCPHAPSY